MLPAACFLPDTTVSKPESYISTKTLRPKFLSTTLPALRSAASNWGAVSVIHFDSHLGRSSRPDSSLLLTLVLFRYMGSERFGRGFVTIRVSLLAKTASQYFDTADQ